MNVTVRDVECLKRIVNSLYPQNVQAARFISTQNGAIALALTIKLYVALTIKLTFQR
ncbi:MAG: hypothetical protein RIM23_16695 [Coleofasciculus sp. G3-WIS-01]|uniref:hypothetical protein n=1 Tax=Coleofasciculus sp. G3-WIS-01 TaxID=3069528 RepID=UPI0032FD0A06